MAVFTQSGWNVKLTMHSKFLTGLHVVVFRLRSKSLMSL
jgi:hypothetical protein